MSEPCIKEEKINRIETDMININSRLNKYSEKIDKISDNNIVLETIMKRLEEDSISQKNTNSEMQKTMISIQGAMTEITFNIKELNNKLSITDDNVNVISKRQDKLDNKGKFDVLSFIVGIIPTFLAAGIGFWLANFLK